MIDRHAALPRAGGGQTAYGSVLEGVSEYPRLGALATCGPTSPATAVVAPVALAACGRIHPSRAAARIARQAMRPAPLRVNNLLLMSLSPCRKTMNLVRNDLGGQALRAPEVPAAIP